MRRHGFEADPKASRGRLIDDLKSAMFPQRYPALRQALFLTDYRWKSLPWPSIMSRFQGL